MADLGPGHLEPDEDADDQFYTLDKWYDPYGQEASGTLLNSSSGLVVGG